MVSGHLLRKDIKLSAEVQPLFKPVPHGLHLFILGGVHVELALGEVAQLGILVLELDTLLATRTLVEKVCLEQSFQLHYHYW